jgi:VWFA-related protein
VIVNASALDSSGRPVSDLTSADFQIFDEGSPQAIASFNVIPGRSGDGKPPPIVILFDLLNAIPGQREFVASQIIKVLEPLEAEEGIYLYLLTNKGELSRTENIQFLQARNNLSTGLKSRHIASQVWSHFMAFSF